MSSLSGSQSSSGFTDVIPQFRHCHLSLFTLFRQYFGGIDPLTPHQSAFVPMPATLQILLASNATAPQFAQIYARVSFGTGTCFISFIAANSLFLR
jgi:hypothetical protein